jgi:hypothetical protein
MFISDLDQNKDNRLKDGFPASIANVEISFIAMI